MFDTALPVESEFPQISTWTDEMLVSVYDDLRHLAAAKLANEAPGQTLQATALVHEAYLRLVSQSNPARWDNPGHFFAAAAEAMRRILIERARRKHSRKHGGGRSRITLEEAERTQGLDHLPENVQSLDEAMCRLESEDPVAASVAKLRIFAALSLEESAQALDLSRSSAFRHWAFARAFLVHEIRED